MSEQPQDDTNDYAWKHLPVPQLDLTPMHALSDPYIHGKLYVLMNDGQWYVTEWQVTDGEPFWGPIDSDAIRKVFPDLDI